jgi:hypothetical protein
MSTALDPLSGGEISGRNDGRLGEQQTQTHGEGIMHFKCLTLPACALAIVVAAPASEAVAACTPTGFVRDSINLTAALINPGHVSGDVDATGCNIGVYYGPGSHGRVSLANIHGANYFGIVNDGGRVDILASSISDIGEKPFNGTQHGVAIYFAFNSNAKGDIRGNYIWNYQKGGIVVNGPLASSDIQGNTVTGLGPVNFIAQNGIQAGFGADTDISRNVVSGNSYTGAGQTASGGILLVGGDCYGGNPTTNTKVQSNIGYGNDVGVYVSNLDASCNAVTTPTKNTVQLNILLNNALNNTTGGGPTQGYQAGIADQGTQDTIQLNEICGLGYQDPGTATTAAFAIDVSATNSPKVKHNSFCGESYSPPASASAMSARRAKHGKSRSAAEYK